MLIMQLKCMHALQAYAPRHSMSIMRSEAVTASGKWRIAWEMVRGEHIRIRIVPSMH